MKAPTKTAKCHLSCASGNVASLCRGPDGHAGKLDYLRTQMKEHGLVVLGIQEARSPAGLSCVDQVLRLAGGAQGHLYGLELWVNLDQPLAYVNKQAIRFKKADFAVVVAEPRLLIVHAVNSVLTAWFVVAHAPQSGRPREEREQWWEHATEQLRKFTDGAPVFVMIDANSSCGRCDDTHVGVWDSEPTHNTPMFRNFLEDFQLCLPATTTVHVGPHDTWTSPDGSFSRRIDYVAVPCDWLWACSHSQVVHTFDLGQEYDHSLVALELTWNFEVSAPRRDKRLPNYANWTTPHYKSLPRDLLANISPPPWHCDIERQVSDFNDAVHGCLAEVRPEGVAKAKKPYITAEIWDCRQMKLRAKTQLRLHRKDWRARFLRATFASWKNLKHVHCVALDFDSGFDPTQRTTMDCTQLRIVSAIYRHAKTLKKMLRCAKAEALQQCVEALPPAASASTILQELRPHIGPSNPLKAKRAALPIVRQVDGTVCTTPQQALDRWVEHFMNMEGGQRLGPADQHALWRQHLVDFQAPEINMTWSQLPSLADVEHACRHVAVAKATGPDGIVSTLVHFQAKQFARLLYSQLVKLATHGAEALVHKGGRLAVAYKHKGPQDVCESYRSLLVSSHPGKVIHKALRSHQCEVFEQYLQREQLGGRRKVPVQLALHMTRTFLRIQGHRGRSVAILFLDLKEAFYRVVRGIVVDAPCDDETLARLASRLQMSSSALHELHALLKEENALVQAGMEPHMQRAIAALHTDTHFHLQGQSDACCTQVGTRPGDSWADVVFSFAWARLLKQLQQELELHGLLDEFPCCHDWTPFGAQRLLPAETSFLGPTWMDDLSLCISGATAQEAEHKVGQAAGILLDMCRNYGMTPNLARGKTEIVFHFRGVGSRAKRRQHYGKQASGFLPVLCEDTTAFIAIAGEYVHLGNLLHHTGQNHKEMKRRVAIAHQSYGVHRRCLYRNLKLDQTKRTQMFESLIVSKLLYGAETWVPDTVKCKLCFHGGVMGLFRRLGGIKHDAHVHDEDVLTQTGMLSPTELLRRQRLRYLTTLYRCADVVPWGMIADDIAWCDLLRSDLQWMHDQLHATSILTDPTSDFQPWVTIIVHHPGYWKRLIRRACSHAILQRAKERGARALHADFVALFRQHGSLSCGPPHKSDPCEDQFYGCLTCNLRCRTRAGEGAHMFRCHGQIAQHRRYCSGTQCSACLKEFHTAGRLSQHLRYQDRCRDQLPARRFSHEHHPGIGSHLDAQQEQALNRLVGAVQAQGPRLPDQIVLAEGANIHAECHHSLAERLLDSSAQEFEDAARALPDEHAVSWSQYKLTLLSLRDGMTADEWQLCHAGRADLERTFRRLCDPGSWTIFDAGRIDHGFKESMLDLYDFETWMIKMCEKGGPWTDLRTPVPRRFRERVFLHIFSGRRRRGDLQAFLEKHVQDRPGTILHVVSVDIIVDEVYGDVRATATKTFWLDGIRQGYVIAMLAGPPCNTFSIARSNEVRSTTGRRGPRVVRTAEEVWGKSCLSLRELDDVGVGNDLLGFSLLAFLLLFLTSGFGVIEHPAAPDDESAATIWRMPIVMVLLNLPGVVLHRVMQGLFGAETAKPTGFMVLNLEDFVHILHSWRLAKEPPKGGSIGLSENGKFLTARLKEYPPALCAGLAQSFMAAFDLSQARDLDCDSIPAPFLHRCQSMVSTEYGHFLGKDFAG